MTTTAQNRWDGWTRPDLDPLSRKADPPWVAELTPLLPMNSLTPSSECPHHGPIKPGDMRVCLICFKSGMDHHPALKIDLRTAPKPEPKVEAKPEPEPTRAEKHTGKPTSGKMARRRARKRTSRV